MAKGLGRGINVFFPDLDVKEEETIQEIIVTELRPNPYQPRKYFNKEAIQELAASIKEHGILQPLIARKSIKGYEIVVVSKVIGGHYLSKENFIKRYFPYAKFVVTESKHLVKGDFMIDDSIAMINSMPEDVKVILYRKDYNQPVECTRKDCMSAYDFNDVYQLIVGD